MIPFHYRVGYEWVEEERLGCDILRPVYLPSSSHIPVIPVSDASQAMNVASQLEIMSFGLAVRSARYDIIVTTKGDCMPVSHNWLMIMAQAIENGYDVVAGYANYANDHTASYVPFMRAVRNLATMHFAAQQSYLYSADTCNMAFRRSTFLSSDMFYTLVNSPRFALSVWANSQKKASSVFSHDSCVLQHMPSDDRCMKEERKAWRVSRRRLKNKWSFRLWFLFHALPPLVALTAVIVCMTCMACFDYSLSESMLWVYTAIGVMVPALYLLYTTIMIRRFNRMLERVNGNQFCFTFSAWWYSLKLIFRCP